MSKNSEDIQNKIKIPNPSQEPPVSSKAANQDLKDMDVLCAFKIKKKRKKLKLGCIKSSGHSQIKIKMPNPSQEPPASTKSSNQDLKDMDVLCTFKIKIESGNLECGCIKDQ